MLLVDLLFLAAMVPQAVSATTSALVLRFVEHFLLLGRKDRAGPAPSRCPLAF